MKKTKAKGQRGNAALLKLRNRQRDSMLKELTWLIYFMEEWYWQSVEMKDAAQYKDPEYLMARWKKIRNGILGGPGYGDGMLQERLNEKMDNVLKRLKADLPHLKETEYYAFSYFAAGFDNLMVAHLLNLKSSKIASTLRSRIKAEFLLLQSEYKFEYLELVPLQQLPNWQRNAIFA